jgi:quinol monooxygenase YgiN
MRDNPRHPSKLLKGVTLAGVRLIIQFTAESASEADKQVEAMADRCRKAQSEPGCVQFEVFRSALRPDTYALLEHWTSQEALDEHRARGMAGSGATVTRVREQYEHQSSS